MTSNVEELATSDLVDQGLEALRAREYQQAHSLWTEVLRRHPDHPRAKRLVRELASWLDRSSERKTSSGTESGSDGGSAENAASQSRVHHIEARVRELERELDHARNRRDQLLNEVEELHAYYGKREADLRANEEQRYQTLAATRDELSERVQTLKNDQRESRDEIQRLNRERDEAQAAEARARSEKENRNSELEALKNDNNELRQATERLRDELKALEEEGQNSQELSERVSALTEERDNLASEVERITAERDEQVSLVEELQQAAKDHEAAMDGLLGQLADAKNESNEANAQLLKIGTEMRELRELHAVETESLTARVTELETQLGNAPGEELVAELESARGTISELKHSNQELEDELLRIESAVEGIASSSSVQQDEPDVARFLLNPEGWKAELCDKRPSSGGSTGAPEPSSADDVSDDLASTRPSGRLSSKETPPPPPGETAPFDGDDFSLEIDISRAIEDSDGEGREISATDELETLLSETPAPKLTSEIQQLEEDELEDDFTFDLNEHRELYVERIRPDEAPGDDLSPMSEFVLSRIGIRARVGDLMDTVGLPAVRTALCLDELRSRKLIQIAD